MAPTHFPTLPLFEKYAKVIVHTNHGVLCGAHFQNDLLEASWLLTRFASLDELHNNLSCFNGHDMPFSLHDCVSCVKTAHANSRDSFCRICDVLKCSIPVSADPTSQCVEDAL